MAGSVLEKNRGFRCRICTGCGLCPGIAPEGPQNKGGTAGGALHVVAEDLFSRKKMPLRGEGKRLAAVDVGTTTIAMLLFHEDGGIADRILSLNPQTEYGADVLSRIRAAEDAECAEAMRRKAAEVLERGVKRFQKQMGEGEELQIVLAANTAMTYLLMGWDTKELGRAPFAAERLSGADTEFMGKPCLILPGISAFVGGDITAGIHACGMAEEEEITLLVDLGTNGELVLGNRSRRIACATAAGPAFEGGVNKGVWGSDMVSILAALRREGILDETGLLGPEYFETGVRAGNVLVTQEAIRSIQLAKAAIAAGIEILLKRYGVDADGVDKVVLAGGFGYYLKPDAAAEIGLLPKKLAGKAFAGGNTALAGALRAGRELFAEGRDFLKVELQRVTENTEVLNLAMEPDFEERYIGAMEINKR